MHDLNDDNRKINQLTRIADSLEEIAELLNCLRFYYATVHRLDLTEVDEEGAEE